MARVVPAGGSHPPAHRRNNAAGRVPRFESGGLRKARRGSGEDGVGAPSSAPIRVDAGRRRARQRRAVRPDRQA